MGLMLCHCWHKTTVSNSLHPLQPHYCGRHGVILLLLLSLTAPPCSSQTSAAASEMSYVPELSFAASSSLSFIPPLSSPNECQTKSSSFNEITFISSSRRPGSVSFTLLPHPDRHVSLQCPSSLIFLTPRFSPTSDLLLAFSPGSCFGCYQPSPPSPAQCFFYCKAMDPLCATQSWIFPPAVRPLDTL